MQTRKNERRENRKFEPTAPRSPVRTAHRSVLMFVRNCGIGAEYSTNS